MNPEQLTKEIEELKNRISKLEQEIGIANRVPIPCPWCSSFKGLKSGETIEVEIIDGFRYQAHCLACLASGPFVLKRENAIRVWNQFVSHRGKMPRE